MSEFIRKIGIYQGSFSYQSSSLLLNLTSQSIILFGRITDSNMPMPLKEIAENCADLFECIKDISDDKIVVNQRYELVLSIAMGRRIKQYIISLQKAEISSEEKDKKRIVELQKLLEQKEFQLNFYKTEYHLLLKNIQLKPNIEQLSNRYMRDVSELALENQPKMLKKANSSYCFQQKNESDRLTMSSLSERVQKGSKLLQQNISLRCPNNHSMVFAKAQHNYFLCNICRNYLKAGASRYNCKECDFDACQNCCDIPPQNRKYCTKLHALKFGCATNYPVRSCDRCSINLSRQKGYTCLTCNFDLCPNCFK